MKLELDARAPKRKPPSNARGFGWFLLMVGMLSFAAGTGASHWWRTWDVDTETLERAERDLIEGCMLQRDMASALEEDPDAACSADRLAALIRALRNSYLEDR